MKRYRKYLFLLHILLCGVLLPGVAHGQNGDIVKKIRKTNKAAMDEYDVLEFDASKQILGSALAAIQEAGLERHKVSAETFLALGIVLAGGFDNFEDALLAFVNALEIDPGSRLPEAYVTPTLKELFLQAKATAGSGGGGGGLQHTPVESASEKRDIVIEARVEEEVGAKKVRLHFRPGSAERFVVRDMKPIGDSVFRAQIPKGTLVSETMHYYITAHDSAGKTIDSSGSKDNPHIVEVTVASAGEGGEYEDDEYSEEDGYSDDEEDEYESNERFFISVAVGTGLAFVTGSTEQKNQPVSCCLATSPFHLTPEVGYWMSSQFALSGYARIGFPLGANLPGHTAVSPALVARANYYTNKSQSGWRFHGDVGFGYVRQTVAIDGADSGMDIDTYATGPFLLGGGFSWIKRIAGPVSFLFDVNLLAGIPVIASIDGSRSQFGVNTDITLGLNFGF